MKTFRCLTHAAVVLACCGLIMPNAVLAGPPVTKQSNDLTLSANGTMSGVLVTAEGHLVDGSVVTVRQGDKEVAKTTSDAKGRFAVSGLTNGIYELGIGSKVVQVRTWNAAIAPPTSQKEAVIVVGLPTRSQGDLMGLDIITLWTLTASTGALVLAAINQSDLNDIQDDINKLKSP